jgi:hypothetical protein
MKRMIGAALLIVLVTACAKRTDDRGMGAGADTAGMRPDTTTTTPAPVPADTTKPPQN